MLEIIALVFLTRALSRQAQHRGRSTGWAALGPLLWILAELAAILFMDAVGVRGLEQFVWGLLAGAIGGGVAYLVVTALPSSPWLTEAAGDA